MGESCRSEFDPDEMWEIHIDPYGNIQTCCGIVTGNAREKPLIEWMTSGFHTDNELVNIVCQRDPCAYLDLAKEYGYQLRDGYPQKCNLC